MKVCTKIETFGNMNPRRQPTRCLATINKQVDADFISDILNECCFYLNTSFHLVVQVFVLRFNAWPEFVLLEIQILRSR